MAFFLDIGLREGLQGLDLGLAAGLTLLSLLKAPLFFLVLLLVGYRARTAFVAGMYLGNHSEFALIVGWPWSGRAFSPTSPPWPWRWPSPWPCPPRSPVTATPYTNA